MSKKRGRGTTGDAGSDDEYIPGRDSTNSGRKRMKGQADSEDGDSSYKPKQKPQASKPKTTRKAQQTPENQAVSRRLIRSTASRPTKGNTISSQSEEKDDDDADTSLKIFGRVATKDDQIEIFYAAWKKRDADALQLAKENVAMEQQLEEMRERMQEKSIELEKKAEELEDLKEYTCALEGCIEEWHTLAECDQ